MTASRVRRRQRLLATGLALASAAVAGLAIELYTLTRPTEAAAGGAPPVRAAVPRPVASPVAVEHAEVDVTRPMAPRLGSAASEPAVESHVPALTSPNIAAHAERETWFARIRDAHAGHEAWDDAGLALLQQLGRDAASVSNEGCYMAGCIAEVTFASLQAYRVAVDAFTSAAAYTSWTGAKHITAPETLANGDVVVAVVLERPD